MTEPRPFELLTYIHSPGWGGGLGNPGKTQVFPKRRR